MYVAGSFNHWRPELTPMIPLGGGWWTRGLALPPGRYEYCPVVDGRWMPDPNAASATRTADGKLRSRLVVHAPQTANDIQHLRIRPLSILTAGAVAFLATLNAPAQTADKHGSHGAAANPALVAQAHPSESARPVFERYFAIQTALARDSLENVSAQARAIATAVRADETSAFPPEVAREADAVAAARGMAKTRKTFQALSDSLIKYAEARGLPPGHFVEVYCPIAKASWLQAGETVRNPYLGLRSATPTWGWACAGVVKARFENPFPSNGPTR